MNKIKMILSVILIIGLFGCSQETTVKKFSKLLKDEIIIEKGSDLTIDDLFAMDEDASEDTKDKLLNAKLFSYNHYLVAENVSDQCFKDRETELATDDNLVFVIFDDSKSNNDLNDEEKYIKFEKEDTESKIYLNQKCTKLFYKDSDGAKATEHSFLIVKYKIQDTIAPIVVTKDVIITEGDRELSIDDFIESIEDASTFEKAFTTEVDLTSIGERELVLVVTDAAGNKTEATAKLIINAKPVAEVPTYYPPVSNGSGNYNPPANNGGGSYNPPSNNGGSNNNGDNYNKPYGYYDSAGTWNCIAWPPITVDECNALRP